MTGFKTSSEGAGGMWWGVKGGRGGGVGGGWRQRNGVSVCECVYVRPSSSTKQTHSPSVHAA